MKKTYLLLLVIFIFSVLGCQTVKKGTTKGGEYIGKGVDAAGGVTEGAVDGYIGNPDEENPFNR